MNDQKLIRNFCVIAHIDHGKSTLSDRFLEITGTVPKSKMKEQVLDQMELEREKGITIKLQPVTMDYQGLELNLIDTPGHVDFSYEVSRSLAACEGAVLLVDATQGIQAQTIANLYLALEQDLVIIPVVNKIDLPNAEVARVKKEIVSLLGADEKEIILVSAKTGQGVADVLDAVIKQVPCPKVDLEKEPRALIFDSTYDEYRGVVIYIRIVAGEIKKGDLIRFIKQGIENEALEVGIFKPEHQSRPSLAAGEIGYIVTGLKEVSSCRVGDTVTLAKSKKVQPLPGYKEVQPMVWAGFFPKEGSELMKLREALERLKLNDAALQVEPEKSSALGVGFRCGFLGLLHLEIIQQRLLREFEIELVVTVPSVAYTVIKTNSKQAVISSPLELPPPPEIKTVLEPWMKVDIVAPAGYIGKIMEMVQEKRGVYKNTEYLDSELAVLHYEMSLSSLIVDFYDKLKSASSGYASLNYDYLEERETRIRRLDVIVAGERIEALSVIIYEDQAYESARSIVKALAKSIPRHLFEVRIQATLGYDERTKSPGKIIASEKVSPLRKDVTGKLYGGDVTRKRKLLEKQKKGKARMRDQGKVNIPTNAFLSVLKR